MAFLYLLDSRLELAVLGLVDHIGVVDTDNGFVCGYLDNVELVDLSELIFLGHGSTCHTGQLVIKTEEVLERDGCERLGLVRYLYAFLCLYRLMKSVVVASALHETTREFIDYDDLALVYNIVDILFHNAVCFERLIYVMQKGGVLGIIEIYKVECLLSLLNASSGDSCGLCLFVYDVVAVLCDLFLIGLGIHLGYYKGLQSLRKAVRKSIELCGLVAPAGYDKRSSRFIYEYGVHLIDNGEVEFSLHLFALVYDHVVTEIVKSEFIVCAVGYVAVVCFTALIVVEVVENTADSESEITEYLTHFLRLCLCKIVIDCYDMDAVTVKCVYIGCTAGNESFSFTCSHLCDTSLMKHRCTDYLHGIGLFAQNSPCRFSYRGKCLGEYIIKGFSLFKSSLELRGLGFQLPFGKSLVFLVKRKNLFEYRVYLFQLSFAVITE